MVRLADAVPIHLRRNAGLRVDEQGRLVRVQKATTLDEAKRRASEILYKLEQRNMHPDVYRFCRSEVREGNHFHAMLEATKSLADKIRDKTGSELDGAQLAYRRIKLRRPQRRDLAVLRELAAWREETAMERNIPRNWIVRDDALSEIAVHRPKDRAQIARVRGMKPHVAKGADGAAMLASVQRAASIPEDEWPTVTRGRPPLPGQESQVALLTALLRLRCDAHGVSMPMVAKRGDLDRLATEEALDVPALHGWRRRIYGADTLELRAGRLALTGDGRGVGEVRVSPADGS